MSDYAFTFCDADFVARPDGTLWWPSKQLLCVSDLHLGKSDRIARRGGTLLPPYETRETLWRLDTAITATAPSCVICLGDSFDDLAAIENVSEDARATLTHMQAGRDWIWIEGNHDAGPVEIGGTHCAEVVIGGITFRHITDGATRGEVTGHFHPKAGPSGLSQRPCFLLDNAKLILPAFGAYTGGLSFRDPVLSELIEPTGLAILTGKTAVAVPVSACLKR